MGKNPLLGNDSGSSSGGSGGGNPLVGGGKKSSGKTISLNAAKIKKLRNAITTGRTEEVVRRGRAMGLSDQNLKALKAVTSGFDQGNKSFVQKLGTDVESTLRGMPKGLARTALAAGKEAVAVPSVIVDAAQGDKITGERLLRAAPVVGSLYATEEAIRTGEENKTNAFTSGLGTSLRRTGLRVAHPKQAVRDYSEHPFSTLLEDAGNVAIVGAAAAKAARLGGLSKTATAIERVNAAPTVVANAPFLPVSRTARLANRAIEGGLRKAVASERMRPIMEHLRMTPEARQVKGALRAGEEAKATASNKIATAFRNQEKILPKVEEQEAMYLIGQGQADALLRAKSLSPGTFDDVIEKTVGGDYSPEGVRLAMDVLEGKNPELQGRITDALKLGRPGRGEREAEYLSRGPASRVEQTGDQPLSLADDPNSLEAAPARLRPALATNRAVAEEMTRQGIPANLTADLPQTLDDLRAAGVNPEHFINPREGMPGGRSGKRGDLNLPRGGRLDESRQRTLKGAHDMTIRGQARAEIRRAHQVIAQKSINEIAQYPFAKRAIDLAQGGKLPTLREIREAGLEAWDPASPFEVATQIGPDTVLVPKAIHESFRSYYTPKNWEKFFEKTYDKATRAFKTVVLPLSPAWNIGNAVTNAFMATFAGGVDPFTLTRQIGAAISHHKQTGEWPGPQRIYGSGSTHETLDFMGRNQLERGGVGRRALTAPMRAGYKVNETVDNMFRAATYLAKKGEGYSDEGAMRITLQALGDFTKMSPFERSVVRRAVPFYAWLRHMAQIAVRMPIEHPMRTAFILAVSNEFKDQEAWETALPGFMQGFIPLSGGNALSVQNFMPFSDPFSAITSPAQNLNPILKFALVNKIGPWHGPMEGINPLTGRPYTRRPGTGAQSEFGQDQPTAPSILQQLRQIPPQVRTADALFGRKDVARYESGQEVKVRGEDGKLHSIPTPQSDLKTWSKYLGVPVTSKKQLKQIVDSILLRQAERWKTAHPVKDTSKSSSGGSSGGNPLLK